MTDKQKRFCNEYLIDCNATRAYKVAYPNVKKNESAKAAASRLLANINLKSYIDEQLQKINSAKIADATEVMEYLSSVMRGESKSSVIVESEEFKKSPDEKEKLKAAELLGKRYSLFTDKVNVESESKVMVIDDV